MVHWESPTGFSHVVAELHSGEVVGAFQGRRADTNEAAPFTMVVGGLKSAVLLVVTRDDFISRLPAAALATCQACFQPSRRGLQLAPTSPPTSSRRRRREPRRASDAPNQSLRRRN